MACCPPVSVTTCSRPAVTRCATPIARDCSTPVDVVCSTGILSVFVCNFNAITDDKWTMFVDGVEVGVYDVGNEARAAIILPLSAQGLTINGLTGRGCTVFDYYYTAALDTVRTKRSFKMRLDQIKGAGNLGDVQFLCTTITETDVTLATTPAGSFTYVNPTPYVVGTVVPYTLRVALA